MKVFELMHELGSLPANTEVKFHTLADISSMTTCEDDEDVYELDYEIGSVEYIELMDENDVVQLSD